MIVKMSFPMDAMIHDSESLLTLPVLENFDLKKFICCYVYQISIMFEECGMSVEETRGDDEMLSKYTCGKLKQGETLSELLADALLILDLQKTRRFPPSGVQ
jgi:hypothetical protein